MRRVLLQLILFRSHIFLWKYIELHECSAHIIRCTRREREKKKTGPRKFKLSLIKIQAQRWSVPPSYHWYILRHVSWCSMPLAIHVHLYHGFYSKSWFAQLGVIGKTRSAQVNLQLQHLFLNANSCSHAQSLIRCPIWPMYALQQGNGISNTTLVQHFTKVLGCSFANTFLRSRNV